MSVLRALLSLWLLFVLTACTSNGERPDLARLYENEIQRPEQPPVILIHGLAGSTLVDAQTGKEFWPGSLSTIAFGNYRELARMSAEDREGTGLVPGSLIYDVAGVDFYGALVHTLEAVGRFQHGAPGDPVQRPEDRRRYYLLLYDWRKDNFEAVRKLHALIEQIRRDYGDPAQKVDIIAHSNGGLIASYYLRYGPTDVLDQDRFPPWDEGGSRVRRLVLLGTPILGSVRSLERLLYGMRVGLRTTPVEVMATFTTPYQALPHPRVESIIAMDGKPVTIDLYDDAVWRQRQWGVFAPEVEQRVRAAMATPTEGEAALQSLQASFVANLHRARKFALALTAPVPPIGVQIAVFGGDCELTPGRAVLREGLEGAPLAFWPGDVNPPKVGEPKPRNAIDYDRLMLEPGDGLVTRASQVAREPMAPGRPRQDFHFFPIMQSFFLCEKHILLTANPYFENNLLYFLLSP